MNSRLRQPKVQLKSMRYAFDSVDQDDVLVSHGNNCYSINDENSKQYDDWYINEVYSSQDCVCILVSQEKYNV